MVGVVFTCGRRLVIFNGEAAIRLNPGVEVYDANGTSVFYSELEVVSITVNGHPITRQKRITRTHELTDDDSPT